MRIYVFSSNELGLHNEYSAKFAKQNYEAMQGVGFGPTGKAFAIPVRDWKLKLLDLTTIEHYIKRFIAYAEANDNYRFDLTKVGAEFNEYSEIEIAPYFKNAPDNVFLVNKQFQTVCLARNWAENIDQII